METDLDTLALVRDLLSAGACGIMFGRALFQSPQPLALMKAVRAILERRDARLFVRKEIAVDAAEPHHKAVARRALDEFGHGVAA